MLQQAGATVVGMSMVPEALPAHALGMRVLGLCSLTNAFGEHVSHEEVVRVSNETAIAVGQAPRGPVPAARDDGRRSRSRRDAARLKDPALAPTGRERIEWAAGEMPVLALIRERFEKERPLEGVRIAACLHVTTETANLMETLAARAAPRSLLARLEPAVDPGRRGRGAHASRAASRRSRSRARTTTRTTSTSTRCSTSTRSITMDDGADLVSVLHTQRADQLDRVIGGTEETTTGRDPPARHGRGRRARVPDRERERRRHEAPVRQPVRDRTVHDRRDHAGDEPAARGADHRGLRVRHVRPRRRVAGPAAWART